MDEEARAEASHCLHARLSQVEDRRAQHASISPVASRSDYLLVERLSGNVPMVPGIMKIAPRMRRAWRLRRDVITTNTGLGTPRSVRVSC